MTCEHLYKDICKISTRLAGVNVPTTPEICLQCQASDPPQGRNHVTHSRAIYQLHQLKLPIPNAMLEAHQGINSGPGTELRKLIGWFVWSHKSKKCSRCYNREQKMNKWGPEGCEKRMDTIVRWLQHSAATNNLPFSKRLVTIMIKRAIMNAKQADTR